ncbi:protein kinase, partial [Coleofasciculus sp. LEGE 07081]
MGLNLLRLFQPTNSEKPLGGRYKIISQLGAGGFGQTFLAEDLHLPDRPQCVVKQLKPQTHDAAFLQTARRLFDTEARVLYQLGNHDQIPRLLAHFEENEEFYLAQELVVGNPLTKELRNGKPWSESQTIALLQDVLQVLAFVHDQNVIHRDIKPSNLMRRSSDDKIVLIDFGAVKQVTTQLLNPSSGKTDLTISIGTQGYVPKEQLGGQPRFSSDIYAVGIIGIQALTGLHPKLLREDSETGEINWRDFAPQVNPELTEFLDLMVRYDFRVRYQTAAAALDALQSISGAIALSLPASAQTPDSTASGTDDLSTHFWVPTNPPVQPQPAASNTAPPTTERHFAHSSGSSSPTLAAPEPAQRRFLKPLFAIAILAAVGGGGLLARTFFFSQFVSQTPTDKTSAEQTAVSSTESAKPPATDRSNLEKTPEKTDKESEPAPSERPVAESTPKDTNPSTSATTQSPKQPAATQTPSASEKPPGTQAPPTSNKPAAPQASPAPSPA